MNDASQLVTIAAESYFDSPDGVVIESGRCHALIRHHSYGLMIGFRGTAEAGDWWSNLDRHRIDAPDDIPGKVHRGFSDSLDEIWGELWEYIKANANGEPILLAGHSRGGAHATIAAARLIVRGVPVLRLHTYGSPRVGNKRFGKYIARHIGEARRYSYESDPVTRLPRFGYKHVGRLWWRIGGKWRHKAGFVRRVGAFLFARRWPFLGDAFNDHRMSNYLQAIGG